MIIERRNTNLGEQVVLIAEEGEILVNGYTKAKVAYIGKGNSILDWRVVVCASEEVEEEVWTETPDTEELKQYFIDGVQAYMDSKAKEYGYDNVFTVCTYIDSRNEKFDHEGAVFRIWRSAVWKFCYAYLDDVLDGKKPIPTLEGLLSQLPEIEW